MGRKRLGITLAALVGAAACAATGATADGGPSPGVSQGWDGVLAPNGKVRYVAVPGGRNRTVVETILVPRGRVESFSVLRGNYGVPLVAYDGTAGGLTRDGKSLILATYSGPAPGAVTRFAIVSTKTLRLRYIVRLSGSYSFDALSPDGKTMYLIEYRSQQTPSPRYRVRAYDLQARRLLSQIVFDRREGERVMSGQPVTRLTTADGVWAYTLYARGRGTPFIHALDTAHRRAVCIDLDGWRGSQNRLWKLRLATSEDGGKLQLRTRAGKLVMEVRAPS